MGDAEALRDVALTSKRLYEEFHPRESWEEPTAEYKAWLLSIGFTPDQVEVWRAYQPGRERNVTDGEAPTFRQAVIFILNSVVSRTSGALGPPPAALVESAADAIVACIPYLTYGELSGQANPRDAV